MDASGRPACARERFLVRTGIRCFFMKRFAFFCLLACCAWGVPLRAANTPAERTPGLGERLRELFGVGAATRRYDARMIRAAEIAAWRAGSATSPRWHCWRSVKDALLEARVISSRPTSPWAKQAGEELCTKYGFTRIPVSNPILAPVGAVIVYGGRDAGHVELRTATGFVSDFISPTPYPRPLIGVYVKPS